MNEFTRLEAYANAFNRHSEIQGLEAIVTSRIVRDQVHFNGGARIS